MSTPSPRRQPFAVDQALYQILFSFPELQQPWEVGFKPPLITGVNAVGRSQDPNPGQTDVGIPTSPLHGATERMRAFWAPLGHFPGAHPATASLGSPHLQPPSAHRWWRLASPLSSQTSHPGLVVTCQCGHTGLPFSYKMIPPGRVSLCPPAPQPQARTARPTVWFMGPTSDSHCQFPGFIPYLVVPSVLTHIWTWEQHN